MHQASAGQATGPVTYVGVSTKMYLGYRSTLDWLERLCHEVDSRPALAAGRVVPFVIPAFPVLPAAAALLLDSPGWWRSATPNAGPTSGKAMPWWRSRSGPPTTPG